VRGAVDVRVLVLVEVGEPIDHRLRLLRRRGVVEPDERATVDALLEDGKVTLDGVRVEMFVLPPSTFSLSVGTSGMPAPRQERRAEQRDRGRRDAAAGALPPEGGDGAGCARKNAGSFHTFAMSSSRSSGVGAPVRVATRIEG
jgi:hypothetical protein